MAIKIVGLDDVVLRVADAERAIAFYSGVLGCREERRVDSLGLIQLRAGASLIDLVGIDATLRTATASVARRGIHLLHWPNDWQKWDERYGADGYAPSMYIRDPDDNVVELKGPPIRKGP